MTINEFKSHFFYNSQRCNFNNAGQALIPDVNKNLASRWLDRFYSEGAACAGDGWAQTEVVRKKLAQFLGADAAELAFFQTTASAISQAAFSIPLKKDDEILTWDQEYPSNFYPWRLAAESSGARVIQVESDYWQTPYEKLLKHVTDKTKVIAISWVQYQTGSVTDLKIISEKLKDKGIWLVADIIQGVGVRPFHFHDSGFDIVCGGSHKWLCSGYGASYMLVKKEKMPSLAPREVGAMTFGDPDTVKSFTIAPKLTAHRYEPGSKAMIEIIAMGATLDLFQSVGMTEIFIEAQRLAEVLCVGLKKIEFKIVGNENGPIINFTHSRSELMNSVELILQSGKVAYAKRGPGIRLSVHAYNRDEEINYVLKLLSEIKR